MPIDQNPKIRFSHLGITVTDIAVMEKFYTEFMGLTVTDRGNALGIDVIFMSYDPSDHHQIVLATGRPAELPKNTANPMFGPCINQMSFALGSLADLRVMHQKLKAAGFQDTQMTLFNHGTAWSIYFADPEGNPVEFFVDSEWYIPQPFGVPFDFADTDDEILAQTEAMCLAHESFMPAKDWREMIGSKMALRQ